MFSDIAVDTLVRTRTLLFPRAAGEQQRPNQCGDRYTSTNHLTSTTLKRPGCIFLPSWTMATLAGFILSLSVLVVGERADLGLWHGIIGGGIVGLLQGLVLVCYGYVLGGSWWIIANFLAWGIAGASTLGVVGWFAPQGEMALLSRLIYGAFDGLKLGILTGFAQWVALRRTISTFSGWWITWNTLAWMLGLACGWAIAGILRQLTNLFIGEVIGLVVAWLIVGLIGGLALSLLLRRPVK